MKHATRPTAFVFVVFFLLFSILSGSAISTTIAAPADNLPSIKIDQKKLNDTYKLSQLV